MRTITLWMVSLCVIFLVLGITAIVLFKLRNKTQDEKKQELIDDSNRSEVKEAEDDMIPLPPID